MKAWALMLVVALALFGWVVFAGAAKVQLTDLELDGVAGGDSSVAGDQTGLGSSSASAQSNEGTVSGSAVVTWTGNQIQEYASQAGVEKKTKSSAKSFQTPGKTFYSVHPKHCFKKSC